MRLGGRIVLGLLLAAGFTLAIVQWSERHGRLVFPPAYDDVRYLADGMARLDRLHGDGLSGLLREHIHRPPPSPFSSYLALASFAVLGPYDWAPYAGNVVIVLAFLGFVDYLMRGSPWWARTAAALFVLTIPVTGEAVAEFRPDFVAALMTAMGVVLLLEHPLVAASKAHLRVAGACFAVALLAQPTVFPYDSFPYPSGPDGQAHLGRHAYLLAALAVAGAARLARRQAALLRPLRNQAIVAAAALAIPALLPVKPIVFGVTFAFLLALITAQVLAVMARTLRESPPDRRGLAASAALVLAGALCAQWPLYRGDGSDSAVQRRTRLQDILRTLRERSQGRDARVFVTAPGRINPDLLQYTARRDGLGLEFDTLCGPRVRCVYLSDDLDLYRHEIDEADYVLLGEPGHSEAVADLPSARVQAPLLDILRSRRDYVERARVPAFDDKALLLFERMGPFYGWTGTRGLLGEEGPYPQWDLPKVRWGLAPSTTLGIEGQDGGPMRIVIEARSGFAAQTMTVRLDGQTLASHAFRNPPVFERIRIPIALAPGAHTVELAYTSWDPALAPASLQRAVLFRTLRIVPDVPARR